MTSPMAAILAVGLKASRLPRDGIQVSAPTLLVLSVILTSARHSHWTGHAKLPRNVEAVPQFALSSEIELQLWTPSSCFLGR